MGWKESLDLMIAENKKLSKAIETTPDDEMVLQERAVYGNGARAFAPRLGRSHNEHLYESVSKAVDNNYRYKPTVVEDPFEIKKFVDPLQRERIGEKQITSRADMPDHGPYMVGKLREAVGDTAYNVITALSIDEHLAVKSLMGNEVKFKDLGDYTWDNYLIYKGAKPGGMTTAMGIGMAVVLSPLTWVTLGAGSGLKMLMGVPAKAGGVALRRRSSKALGEVVKAYSDKHIDKLKYKAFENKRFAELAGESKKKFELMKKAKGKKKMALAEPFDAKKIRQQAKADAEMTLATSPNTIKNFRLKNEALIRDKWRKEGERTLLNMANPDLKLNKAIIKTPQKFIDDVGKILDQRGAGKYFDVNYGESFKKIPGRVLSGSPLIHQADVSFMGRTIIPGEWLLHTANKLKVPQLFNYVSELKPIKYTTDGFRKMFIKDWNVPKELVMAVRESEDVAGLVNNPKIKQKYSDFEINSAKLLAQTSELSSQAERFKRKALDEADTFFKGLTDEQRRNFSDTAIWASTLTKKQYIQARRRIIKKGFAIKETAAAGEKTIKRYKMEDFKDAKVQDRLDAWFGQGKYEGKGMADELWEQSINWGIIPPKTGRKPNWYPGVAKKASIQRLKFNEPLKPAEREFLRERVGLDVDIYTHDPVHALSYRQTQIWIANAQDKMYEEIVKGKFGKVFSKKDVEVIYGSAEAAAKAGIVEIKRPKAYALNKSITPTLEEQAHMAAKPSFYGREDFANVWNENYTSSYWVGEGKYSNMMFDLIDKYTGIWKLNVTATHPAYHFMNFNSNIVLNSMKIGHHIFDTKAHMAGVYAALDESKTLKWLADSKLSQKSETVRKMVQNGMKAARGKLDEEIELYGGQKMKLMALVDEAAENNVIHRDMLAFDIGGETLPAGARFTWGERLMQMNPASHQFAPYQIGRKFASTIENQMRLQNYIVNRGKGLSPQMAALETAETLYDYGNLTKFERSANLFVPFYTFSRRNIANYMKMSVTKPGLVTSQLKFWQTMLPSGDELRERYPSWVGKRVTAKWGDKLTMGFQLPIEDILNFVPNEDTKVLSRINPILKVGIERGTGRDLWSGRELDKVVSGDEFGFVYKLAKSDLPDWLTASAKQIVKLVGVEEIVDRQGRKRYEIDPDMRHLLANFWTARYASYAQYATKNLNEEDSGTLKVALRYLTGLYTVEPDPGLKLAIERSKARNKARYDMFETKMLKHAEQGPWGWYVRSTKGKGVEKLATSLLESFRYGYDVKSTRAIYEDIKKTVNQLEDERVRVQVEP